MAVDMTTKNKALVADLIKKFNKNLQVAGLAATSKKNHRSIFIDFYFENIDKNQSK